MSKLINVACILTGGVVAIYAQAEAQQNTYLLIGGIVVLMFGIYRVSRNISGKNEKQEEETFIKTEDEN